MEGTKEKKGGGREGMVYCGVRVGFREEGRVYLVVRGWGPGRKGGSSQSLGMRNIALPLRPRKKWRHIKFTDHFHGKKAGTGSKPEW